MGGVGATLTNPSPTLPLDVLTVPPLSRPARKTPPTDFIMLSNRPNPLLAKSHDPVADPASIRRAHTKLVHDRYRDIRDLRRAQTAADAVAGLALDGRRIFGLTRGQFSFINIIDAILQTTGPAAIELSTWTASSENVTATLDLIDTGRITAARWLFDFSFVRRCPQAAARIRQRFGDDSIRVTKTHAKYCVVHNDAWKVVCLTSANLNNNPRLEFFQVAHDPELADFLIAAMDDCWTKQRRNLADDRIANITAWWNQHG